MNNQGYLRIAKTVFSIQTAHIYMASGMRGALVFWGKSAKKSRPLRP
jgi:hypothetical protein